MGKKAMNETFAAFAKRHGILLLCRERMKPYEEATRYYACGQNLQGGAMGVGSTKEEAMAQFARRLRGKTLFIDPWGAKREARCPDEWGLEKATE